MNMSIGVCGVGYNTLSHPVFHDLLQWGSAVVLGVIPVSVLIGCNFVFARALFNREKQMSKQTSKPKLRGDAKKVRKIYVIKTRWLSNQDGYYRELRVDKAVINEYPGWGAR